MNISIEVTPRDEAHVHEEVARIRQHLLRVNMINVPDILRFSLRSWRACKLVTAHYPRAIPHLRAIDFDPNAPLGIVGELAEAGLTQVLVISGDNNRATLRPVYPTDSISMIKRLKREHPHLTVYAGIDPYRQSFQAEARYAREKLEAGAAGFFTQPFFDLRLMAIYAELLPDVEIYWGVSPVLSERSVAYWETVNQAIFPAGFEPTLAWNRAFAKDTLDFAAAQGGSIYYMPIRADVIAYLQGIL